MKGLRLGPALIHTAKCKLGHTHGANGMNQLDYSEANKPPIDPMQFSFQFAWQCQPQGCAHACPTSGRRLLWQVCTSGRLADRRPVQAQEMSHDILGVSMAFSDR